MRAKSYSFPKWRAGWRERHLIKELGSFRDLETPRCSRKACWARARLWQGQTVLAWLTEWFLNPFLVTASPAHLYIHFSTAAVPKSCASYQSNYSIWKESYPIFLSLCVFSETHLKQHPFFEWLLLAAFRTTTFGGPKNNTPRLTRILLLGYFQASFHFGFSLCSGKELGLSVLETFFFCSAAAMFISSQLWYLEILFWGRIVQLQSKDQNSIVGLFNL